MSWELQGHSFWEVSSTQGHPRRKQLPESVCSCKQVPPMLLVGNPNKPTESSVCHQCPAQEEHTPPGESLAVGTVTLGTGQDSHTTSQKARFVS